MNAHYGRLILSNRFEQLRNATQCIPSSLEFTNCDRRQKESSQGKRTEVLPRLLELHLLYIELPLRSTLNILHGARWTLKLVIQSWKFWYIFLSFATCLLFRIRRPYATINYAIAALFNVIKTRRRTTLNAPFLMNRNYKNFRVRFFAWKEEQNAKNRKKKVRR